jgi:hypothetical protein
MSSPVGDCDANPYSLCLACLIGAVFSERVSRWARDRVAGEGHDATQRGRVDGIPEANAAGAAAPGPT